MEATVSITKSLITTPTASSSSRNPNFLFHLRRHLSGHPLRHEFSRISTTSTTIKTTTSDALLISFPTLSFLSSVAAKSPSQTLLQRRLHCLGNAAGSASPFDSSGGGGGFGGESGGSGGGSAGGGSDGSGDSNEKPVSAAGEESAAAATSDVIVLDVGGMTCGGCAASVKRILESQPQVASASVNLTTETAIVWPVSGAMSVPNWKKEIGEALAKHLTNCGFTSNHRGQEAFEGDVIP